jgi:uncharacterized protein
VTDAPLPRPLPRITEMNQHFWCGGADGQLHIRKCLDCGVYHHPYQAACAACGSRRIEAVPVSGRGTVVAVTINHQPWFPDVPAPYALALVELEEQSDLRLMTNLLEVPFEAARAGMAVKVCFEQHGEIFVPLFEPVDGEDSADA